MSDISTSDVDRAEGPAPYEIRVRGHLAARWAGRFEGMTLVHQDNGTTVIHGPVADQSALHGLLRTIGDIGVPLVSVATHRSDAPEEGQI